MAYKNISYREQDYQCTNCGKICTVSLLGGNYSAIYHHCGLSKYPYDDMKKTPFISFEDRTAWVGEKYPMKPCSKIRQGSRWLYYDMT